MSFSIINPIMAETTENYSYSSSSSNSSSTNRRISTSFFETVPSNSMSLINTELKPFSDVKKFLDALDKRIETLSIEHSDISTKLDGCIKETAQVEAGVKESTIQIKRLEEQLEKSLTSLQLKEIQSVSNQTNQAKLLQDFKTSSIHMGDPENFTKGLEHHTKLLEELKTVNQTIKALELEISDDQKEIDKLKNTINSLYLQKADAENRLRNLPESHGTLSLQLKKIQTSITNLEKDKTLLRRINENVCRPHFGGIRPSSSSSLTFSQADLSSSTSSSSSFIQLPEAMQMNENETHLNTSESEEISSNAADSMQIGSHVEISTAIGRLPNSTDNYPSHTLFTNAPLHKLLCKHTLSEKELSETLDRYPESVNVCVNGWHPLQILVRIAPKKSKLLGILLDRNADYSITKFGMNLLQLACLPQPGTVIIDGRHAEIIKALLKLNLSIDGIEGTIPPLHLLAYYKIPSLLEILLEHPSVDVNKLDPDGHSVLFYALRDTYLLKIVLKSRAKEQINRLEGPEGSKMPLITHAVIGGFLESVRLLISNGADISQKDQAGRSCYEYTNRKTELNKNIRKLIKEYILR